MDECGKCAWNGPLRTKSGPCALCRFFDKVDKAGPTPVDRPDLGPCWIWTGATTARGYGRFQPGPERGVWYVHRLIYDWAVGPIPDGHEIDHVCRRKSCCNPMHLEAVTHAENVARWAVSAEPPELAEACTAGHAYTPENTMTIRVKGRPSRACRTCHRARQRRASKARRNRTTEPPTGAR